ncbi:hypothetical protein BGZ63DRAFT_350120 [Mariannaea sp. PMI_226]|nr:hypothetical protein BGZ63DRAFT_350120 [Mariannaea sp. PMI_226]
MSSLTNPDVPKNRPAFIPLEANPQLMTSLIHKLGVSDALQIHDVYSLTDPDLLAFIPRPALAVLLVFPVSATYESARIAEDSLVEDYSGKGDAEPVLWWRQTIRNACGLMGLLHATANGPAKSFIQDGSTLDEIIKKSTPLGPVDRSLVLEQTPALANAHREAASEGDTPAPAAEDDIDLHYVCFTKGSDGALWELDGRRRGPIRRGDLTENEDVLSEKALSLGPLEFLKREGEDLRFSAVALAGAQISIEKTQKFYIQITGSHMADFEPGIARWLLGNNSENVGVLMGNDAAGKTTLLYQLKCGEHVQTIPTIGFNVETIESPDRSKITLWDIGGCDMIRPLIRHYIVKDRFIVFIHDCHDAERLDYSLEHLHAGAQWMIDAGCRYMWVLFNKQDLLPPAERESIVGGLRTRFEAELKQYQDKISVKIMDTPGLSAVSGDQLDVVMNDIRDTLQGTSKSSQKSTKDQVAKLEQGPSEMELVERIKVANQNSIGPDQFWKSFMSGDLDSWDHYSHLRAGFFVLIEGLSKGARLLECATNFLEQLNTLRQKNPERFRNTAHKTMTIFWLYQIQAAAIAFQAERSFTKFPSQADFGEILLSTPTLMNSGLWKSYYSKDLLFSPGAREYWHLPDLQPLPSFKLQTTDSGPDIMPQVMENSYRLPRFAFAVVQKTLSSKLRRGGVVKQALESLQASTIRLRASNNLINPYSETQSYFWIQLVHALLKSLEINATSPSQAMTEADVPGAKLTFDAFRVLFDLSGDEWKTYYSPGVWDSIQARMAFVPPDRKPLPNVLARPSSAKMELARLRMIKASTQQIAKPLELPPKEELEFAAAVLIDEANLEGGLGVASHAGLLRHLHRQLSSGNQPAQQRGNKHPIGSIAAHTAIELSQALGSTRSMFWVQQAQIAMAKSDTISTFEKFIHENPQLAYEDLPLLYYSPELWDSAEAKATFVLPDRQHLSSIVPKPTVK